MALLFARALIARLAPLLGAKAPAMLTRGAVLLFARALIARLAPLLGAKAPAMLTRRTVLLSMLTR